jgi:hypothetical protein
MLVLDDFTQGFNAYDAQAWMQTLHFTRYRLDGSIIASYDSLYIVTLEHGRWAVKMRSSFA